MIHIPKNSQKIIHYIYTLLLFLICIGSLFVKSSVFIATKWYFVLGACIIISLIYLIDISLTRGKGIMSFPLKWIPGIIIFSCTLQAAFGIYLLITKDVNIPIKGSFDNQAGYASCLSAVFPLYFYHYNRCNLYNKLLTSAIVIITISAVLLSGSRAGIISVIIITIILLYTHTRKNKRIIILIFSCTFFILLCGALYLFKKESANGRLLIWKCSLEMIKNKPIFGWGEQGFDAHYMDYQSYYLKKELDENYAQLADNIKSPFNEYLSVLISYGIVGFIFLIIFCSFIIYCYSRNKNQLSFYFSLVLLSIAIFSLFSYPFIYPMTWILVYISIAIITAPILKNQSIFLTHLVLISLLIAGVIKNKEKHINNISDEKEWQYISKLPLQGNTEPALIRYEKLKSTLSDNPFFLYNYSVELYEAKHYKKGLEIALLCRNLWADYDLELLLGELYSNLYLYKNAELHYKKASYMCPNRFLPLYYLVNTYNKLNEIQKADSLAIKILNKPVKIQSNAIDVIKNQMKIRIENKKETY